MADRRTESPTHAAREGRAAAENALVEVLATWGGSAQSEVADLLKVIASFQNASDLLRELNEKGRDWLPAALRDEVHQTVVILGTGEPLGAPSFRARVDQVLAKAREALEPRIAERRAALSDQLRSWALVLDDEQLDRALRCLWRSERSAGLADQIAVIGDLQLAQSILSSTRQAITSEIGERLAAVPAAEAGPDILKAAREALGREDPLALLQSRVALEALQSRQSQNTVRDRLAQARARLAALCERARHQDGAGGLLSDGGAARVRADAVAGAERALQASVDGAGVATLFETVLAAWERTLEAILGAGQAEDGKARDERDRLVQSVRAELERVAPRERVTEEPGQGEVTRESALIEEALRAAVAAGDRSFQEALERATSLLRNVRRRADSRLEEGAARLRAAARDLAAFLEKTADRLPTARVVQARLWLEQVDGIQASREAGAVDSLTRTLREDLERMRELAGLVQKRRTNREEAERDALRSEAARLAEVSPRGLARRLEALSAEAERCDGRRLVELRGRLERTRTEIERGIRLEGGRLFHQADRWTRRKGGRAAGHLPERAQGVARGLEGLSAALDKSDLAAVRQRTAELRASFHAVAPASRPWVRMALIAVGLGVLASVPLALRHVWNRPQTCLVKLEAPPPKPVRVWVVRDGRIVGDEEYGASDDGLRFNLPPGRYEVFVNERYTGRVIRIPDDTEVTDIPLPPG